MRLSTAMVFAKDMKRMTAFYRFGVGLKLVEEKSKSDWSEFDAGGAIFALHEIPDHIARHIEIKTPPQARGDNPIKLFFETDDVRTAREQVIAYGGVMEEVHERLGTPSCSGLDPEGNVFTLLQA